MAAESGHDKKQGKLTLIGILFQGKALENEFFLRNRKFILYLFLLGVLYISLNFYYEKSIAANKNNETIIKNLIADYSSKNAKLLYKSKRGEINNLLKQKGSEVTKPENPAKRIIVD